MTMHKTDKILNNSNSNARILLLDDEVEQRATLASMLAEKGYEVAEVDNGIEAINLHRQNPFDIIVIELVLSGKDGFETLLALGHKSSNTRFIVTAKTSLIAAEISLRMALQLGAHFSLAKPFQNEELLELVTRALGK